MARSMLGDNETILGMVCSSKVEQLKLCETFVRFMKERKISTCNRSINHKASIQQT